MYEFGLVLPCRRHVGNLGSPLGGSGRANVVLVYLAFVARSDLVSNHVFGNRDGQTLSVEGSPPQIATDGLIVGKDRVFFDIGIVPRSLVEALESRDYIKELFLIVGCEVAVVKKSP